MTKTHRTKGRTAGTITKGWSAPKGKCDMCRTNPATHWFGDTSVALCDEDVCLERNNSNWQNMLNEMEDNDY